MAEAEELEGMVHEISEFSEETLVEVAESQEEVTEEEASVTEGDPPEEEQEEAAEEDDEGKQPSKDLFLSQIQEFGSEEGGGPPRSCLACKIMEPRP